MNNETIATYVRDERARGVSDTDIKNELAKQGWEEMDIMKTMENGGMDSANSSATLTDPKKLFPTTGLMPLGKLISTSWTEYTEHFQQIVALFWAPLIVSAIGTIMNGGQQTRTMMLPSTVGVTPLPTFGLGLLSFIGGVLIIFASIALVRQIRSGWTLTTEGAYKESLHYFLPALWVSLLSGLAFCSGISLFVIPGIIFAIWYGFSRPALLLDDVRGLSALTYSRELVRDFVGDVFVKFLLFGILLMFVVVTLSLLPLVGFLYPLIATPLSLIFLVTLYKNLKTHKPEVTPENAFAKNARTAKILIIIGIIFLLLMVTFVTIVLRLIPYDVMVNGMR